MAPLRYKVQHNNKELGPYSVADMRQAADSGRICMMDWCWSHDAFDGILTVYQILCEERANGKGPGFLTEVQPRRGSLAVVRGVAVELRERRALEASKNEFEEYRRRTLQDIERERAAMSEARKKLVREQAAFFRECAKQETEVAHTREDIERIRGTLVDDRRRIAEHQHRHSHNVATFAKVKKQSLGHLSENRKKLRTVAATPGG